MKTPRKSRIAIGSLILAGVLAMFVGLMTQGGGLAFAYHPRPDHHLRLMP